MDPKKDRVERPELPTPGPLHIAALNAAVKEAAQAVVMFNLFDLPDARLGNMMLDFILRSSLVPMKISEVKAKLVTEYGLDLELVERETRDAAPVWGATIRKVATELCGKLA